jgi:signal transduction histidine kinase
VVAHLLGAAHAGAPDGGLVTAGIQTLQVVAIAILMLLMHRAARSADRTLLRLRRDEELSAARTARREEEGRQNDILHGTVLATLTVVATGALLRSTARLRARASDDVAVLNGLRAATTAPKTPETVPVRLDERLRAVADNAEVRVRTELPPTMAPPPVADAVVGAALEALANVARHARVTDATLRLGGTTNLITVEITDRGIGFDHAAIPPQRYGVRHAITSAMRRVGGDATVDPGHGGGTRVLLRWPG